jgi:hypothetical protein
MGGKTAKRERVVLSIKDKVALLTRVDKGASVKLLCGEFGVGSSTMYDLKKQKEKLLKSYVDSDLPS